MLQIKGNDENYTGLILDKINKNINNYVEGY